MGLRRSKTGGKLTVEIDTMSNVRLLQKVHELFIDLSEPGYANVVCRVDTTMHRWDDTDPNVASCVSASIKLMSSAGSATATLRKFAMTRRAISPAQRN